MRGSAPRSVADAARALRQGTIASTDLVHQALVRITSDELTANAFARDDERRELVAARARRDALASDERRRRMSSSECSTRSALDGVPFAVKENIWVRDVECAAGSAMLRGYRPSSDAACVRALRECAGGVLVGMTNMDEFGMGSHGVTSKRGVVRNPLDVERVAGGSSAGSAACVANGSAYYALGSDTGGSVRLPAAYCGVVGLKPTYGRVSRHGLIAYCSSMDTVGVLARTVGDAGIVLAAMQGECALDATTVERCADLDAVAKEMLAETVNDESLRGVRVGIPEEYAVPELTQEVYDAWNETARAMEDLGAEIVPVKMQHTEVALACYYILAPAEASSNLARYDGVRYGDLTKKVTREEFLGEEFQIAIAKARSAGFGDEVRRRLLVGTFALSSERTAKYFTRAQIVRSLVMQDFTDVFDNGGVDLLLTPASVSTAPKIKDVAAMRPELAYATDVMTVPASLAGLPAMSMPAGRSRSSGMPIGVQLIAPRFRESSLIRVGSKIERAMNTSKRGYATVIASSSSIDSSAELVLKRRDELTALLSEQGIAIDRVIKANKELSKLEPIVEQYRIVEALRKEKASLEQLTAGRTASTDADDEQDAELAELAREELRTIDQTLPKEEMILQMMFLPKDEADDRGAILEVRAGTGGDEAALFAAELFRMYMLHSRKSGWSFQVLNISETDGKGVREASAEVLGDGVFGRLKFESGVHRVQRVPETETLGRVHTSTASVAVLPHAEEVELDLKEEDVRIDTMRASGAGGQHVNTTESAVRLTHIPTGIVVVIQDERSQHKNKAKAFSLLRARLYELEREKLAKERAELRSSLIGSGDRSERIRTYNFAAGRVKDHRAPELTIGDTKALMDGFLLDEITDTLALKRAEELLKSVSSTMSGGGSNNSSS